MIAGEPGRRVFDIAPAAIVKILAVIVLVWLWLHLWQLFLLVIVAAVLAISLDPLVDWLSRHKLPRGAGATLVVLGLALLVGGFLVLAGSSLVGQAQMLGGRLADVQHTILERLPPLLASAVRKQQVTSSNPTAVAGYAWWAGEWLTTGLLVAVMGLILTVYFLIEGRQAYAWLAAYAPPAHRGRVITTARESVTAIRAYVVGNAATSLFAGIVVLVALELLQVPGALLLAVLAGLLDFIPVLGFICAVVPAVLLALTRSVPIAVAVVGVYGLYHLLENYYIGPRVYGKQLRLSNLAVIVAFAAGAEIGGVVGALLALPVAAIYPVVERVWLREYLARDTVESHQRIQQQSA